tara:strand:+ start:2424 stop:2681 length:258 start_codon:yes stop_codon:yes gene_type:complete
MTLDDKDNFGELSAEAFEVGDIVEWCIWDSPTGEWTSVYGVLLDVKNEIRSDRVVSISKVMPLNEPHVEMEFFTLSLKPVIIQEK